MTSDSRLNRRALLRLGAVAGLGAGFTLPLTARAAEAPLLTPSVDALIERWIAPGKLPGIISSIGRRDEQPRFYARGREGFSDFDPVTADSLFRIYSMTKPVTGMAAMMLIDEGRIQLDQPVADILPEFARMSVQDVYDGSITAVHPAKAPIRIRNLVTHTAGLGYGIIQRGPLSQAMREQGVVASVVTRAPIPGLDRGQPAPSLALFAERLAALPLVYEPGTKWSYSFGLDLMGRVIEVVTGIPFDKFLRERLFDPLGMTSTFFQVPEQQARRLTTNNAVVHGKVFPIDQGSTSIYLAKPAFPFGGSGLVSSPRDYDRFLAMIASYGTLGGRRVMSEKAVRMGTSNLMPAGVAAPGWASPGGGFGAGGMVSEGSYGWAGSAGTVAAAHLRSGLRTQFYTQFMPSGALPIMEEYRAALHMDLAALAERTR